MTNHYDDKLNNYFNNNFLNLRNSAVVNEPFLLNSKSFSKIFPSFFESAGTVTGFNSEPRAKAFFNFDLPNIGTFNGLKIPPSLGNRGNIGKIGIGNIGNGGKTGGKKGGKKGIIGNFGKNGGNKTGAVKIGNLGARGDFSFLNDSDSLKGGGLDGSL